MKTHLSKQILSIVLAVLILCSVFVSTASASQNSTPKKSIPVVMVSGFAASPLAKKTASGKLEIIYPPTQIQIAKALGLNADNLLSALLKFDDAQLKQAVEKIVSTFLEPLKMNPDGTSKYDIVPYLTGAKNTNLTALKKNGNTKYIPYGTSKFFDMQSLGDEIGEDNVFNFMYDWRLDSEDNAKQLHEYIEEVLELTGQDKVNVYAISQGTHVFGTYLYNYSNDNYVKNVFLDSPAMGGSSMVADIISGKPLSFHYDEFFAFLEAVIHTEHNLSILTNAISEDRLDKILSFAVQDIVLPLLKYAPIVWELCEPSKYEQSKNLNLDPVLNAKLIEKVEHSKLGFPSHIKETLRTQDEKGKVVILAGYGSPIFSGTDISSDGVVDTANATGAVVAKLGEKFPENYKQAIATPKSLISPDRTVDLSTAYLPDSTWLIKDYYHGQIEMDSIAYSLVMQTLTQDEINNAHSQYDCPQFTDTMAPNSDISVYFKSTNTTVLPVFTPLTYKGNTVVIKNNSRTQKIAVNSIECENDTLKFQMISPLILNPGQEMEISFKGKVLTHDSLDSITVNYRRLDAEFVKNESRTFEFSISKNYAGVSKLALTPSAITNINQVINLTNHLNTPIGSMKKVIENLSKIISGVAPAA